MALGGALAGHGAYLAAKAALAQHLLDRAWARTLRDGAPQPPWFWADTHPVFRLHVPAHDIHQIVLAGGSGRTLAFGPGHVTGTVLPGDHGLSVISGHRDTHFRFLEQLEPGDRLRVERPGATHQYVVRRTAVIDLEHDDLAVDPAVDQLVLVTCYPFRQWTPGGSRRFLAIARPLARAPSPPPGAALASARPSGNNDIEHRRSIAAARTLQNAAAGRIDSAWP